MIVKCDDDDDDGDGDDDNGDDDGDGDGGDVETDDIRRMQLSEDATCSIFPTK